jgi:hypothetical protein
LCRGYWNRVRKGLISRGGGEQPGKANLQLGPGYSDCALAAVGEDDEMMCNCGARKHRMACYNG